MEESADEVNKREELLKMYHSTKEALKIISKSNAIGELSLNIIVKPSSLREGDVTSIFVLPHLIMIIQW